MKIEIPQALIDEGFVTKRKHPILPLYVYNYTQKTQFESNWSEHTSICRGLILDDENNIVARPFAKFHNYSEYGEGTKLGLLPKYNTFDVYDKADGSLIIVTCHKNDIIVSTRGSFESDQAKWASEYIFNKGIRAEQFVEGWTYLFEGIYPTNRIVIDYKGQEKLVLLSVIENETSNELNYEELERIAKRLNCDLITKYNGITDFTTVLQELPRDNAEGFVVKFDNGTRVKFKYDHYVALHKIMFGVSTTAIWEALKVGQDESIYSTLPDELYNWIKQTTVKLKQAYRDIELASRTLFVIANELPTRKEQALYLMQPELKKYATVVFKMLDDKPYNQLIWKIIKPEFKKISDKIE